MLAARSVGVGNHLRLVRFFIVKVLRVPRAARPIVDVPERKNVTISDS